MTIHGSKIMFGNIKIDDGSNAAQEEKTEEAQALLPIGKEKSDYSD